MHPQPTPRSLRLLARGAALAALFAAACAEVGGPPPAQPAAAPQITETQLRERAKENLDRGLRQYERGEYDDAAKSLVASLDHGLLTKPEQSTARKYLAFIHCVSDRERQCRDEFRKAIEIDPGFTLGPAEAGHPIWGPIFRNVREQMIAAAPEQAPATSKPAAATTPAQRMLADGLAKYDAGEFDAAAKLLHEALKEGLADKSEQIRAHKYAAFSLCLLRKQAACRAEFMKIFDLEPDFDLAPAEAKHPSWARTYAAAKRSAKAKPHGGRKQ
jgi:Tfp pilus assembly protein PilF